MLENLSNKERELKILLNKNQFNKLLNSYDFHNKIIQTNTYYDSPENIVKSMDGAVRIRTINDKRFIFTLKKRIDPITLIELEKEIESDDLKQLKDPEVLKWLKEYHIPLEKLEPITTFTTIRHIIKTKDAEICLDENKFGNKIDYEAEYEYKIDHDGRKEFNTFLHTIGLEYKKNCSSKLSRAMLYKN